MNNLKHILMILFLVHIFIISVFAQNLFDHRVDYSVKINLDRNWLPIKCLVDDIDVDSHKDVVLLLGEYTDFYFDLTFFVKVFMNDGHGNFQQTGDCIIQSEVGPLFLFDMVNADFNNDSYPDLAIAGDSLFVLFGDGTGNFSINRLPYQNYSHAVTAADIDNDLDMDLIYAHRESDTAFTVLSNDGTGVFNQNKQYITTLAPNEFNVDIAVADLNHDDFSDVLILVDKIHINRGISIFLNDKTGKFIEHSFQTAEVGYAFAVTDLNSDGLYDIALANISRTKSLSILISDENFIFSNIYNYSKIKGKLGFRDVVTFDKNNDNLIDISAIKDSLYIFTNVGNDSFFLSEIQECQFHPHLGEDLFLCSNDIDNDGDIDIVTTSFGTIYNGGFSIYYNSMINVGINQHNEFIEKNFHLFPNYPNPFNPTTNISYILDKSCDVNIVIYNTLGVKIKTLCRNSQPAGKNTITWNGTDDWGKQVASGIYFVHFRTDSYRQTQKVMLMR